MVWVCLYQKKDRDIAILTCEVDLELDHDYNGEAVGDVRRVPWVQELCSMIT